MMKFGSVDIPVNLIKSLQENKVIIFAGAGVSMGSPANLPDFITLTRKILNLDELEKFDNPDQKLGEGFDQGVRIHEQCIRVLNQGTPEPTKLHHGILKLFPKKPRIITTNFDLLFETAFKNLNPDGVINKFNAPVFPLGNNIEGVIYLHGNVTEPSSMVLSDSDFGRAYLSESWAKRLLTDAFLNYDFIFIGYSYNDTILKYLTRSLPKNRKSRLYAFANIEDGNIQQVNHWKSLGIEPLIYQKENGTHLQLPEAVEKIAHFLNLSISSYEEFICSKVKEYEQNQLEDAKNYVKFFLTSDHAYKHFFKVAKPEVWLKKIKEDRSLFDAVMKHEDEFFQWALCYLDQHSDELMELIIQYSNLKNNQNLLWRIFRKLDDSQEKNCYWKWFLFLEKDLYAQNNLHNIVHSWVCKKLIDFDLIKEFGRAFEAYLSIQIKPEIQFSISEYEFFSIIERVKGNRFFYHQTIQILINKVEEYDNILTLYGKQKIHTLWTKQEIWEKDKNYSTELDYDLVDGIVDLFSEEKLSNDIVNHFSKECLSSSSILLKRLGIYLLSKFSSYDTDFIYSLINLKIDWFDIEFKAEVFKFLELQYKKLSDARKLEIITQVKNNENFSNYTKFEWYAWIIRNDPYYSLAQKEYDLVISNNSYFELDDKPYLSFRSSGGYSVINISPFDVNEIQARNDYIWYVALLEYNFYQPSFNGGNDLGYVGLWQEIEKAEPKWLLDFINFAIEATPEHPLIERILIRAKSWQFDQTVHKSFFVTCQSIIRLKHDQKLYALADFLHDLHNIDYYLKDLKKYSEWIEVAEIILNLNKNQGSSVSGDVDKFTLSLNSVNGFLAWFIIKLYELSKDEIGIQKECEIFIKFLITKDSEGYGVIRFMSCYSFIKKRNSLFAQKELFPLLLSTDSKIQLQAWNGFLRNAHLEFAEFREINREFFNILQCSLNHNDKQLIRGLTELYVYSLYFEYHEDSIKSLRKLQRLENQEITEQILETVRKILPKENDIEKVWSWLGEYINDRINQVNQLLTKNEISKIWYLLTDHSAIIVNLKEIVVQLPFKEEWVGFLHDMSRNHVDIVLGQESLWCEILGFYLDNQDDRITGFIYDDERNFLKSLIDYDDETILQTALSKKGIRL